MAAKDQKAISSDEAAVVSFRAPRELVAQLDEIAKGDQRTRANFIVRILTHAVTLEPAVATIEQILPRLAELAEKDPDGIQTEYYRGAMGGARSMLAAFFGKRAIRWVDRQVRARTGLPIPTVIPLSEDGSRYGFDTEADIY
jgi:predicted transcriptional regulator